MKWDLVSPEMAGLGRWKGVVFQVIPSMMKSSLEQ
jgi:hypothetical protein